MKHVIIIWISLCTILSIQQPILNGQTPKFIQKISSFFNTIPSSVQRIWHCRPTSPGFDCTKKELNTSKKWFIGGSVAVLTALLAAAGIAAHKAMIYAEKNAVTDDPLVEEIRQKDLAQYTEKLRDPSWNPNETNSNGETPLMMATTSGNIELVQKLLQAGANPYLEDVYGNSSQSLVNDLLERHEENTKYQVIQGLLQEHKTTP